MKAQKNGKQRPRFIDNEEKRSQGTRRPSVRLRARSKGRSGCSQGHRIAARERTGQEYLDVEVSTFRKTKIKLRFTAFLRIFRKWASNTLKSLLNTFLNGTILDHLRYTLNILGILRNRGKLLEGLHKLAHNFIHLPPVVKFAHWR